jgi:hypothetical protein
MLVKIDNISKKIAKELGVSEHVMMEVNRSQWKLLHETIQSNTLKPVKIMYLGKFSKKLKMSHEFRLRKHLSGIQKPDIQE